MNQFHGSAEVQVFCKDYGRCISSSSIQKVSLSIVHVNATTLVKGRAGARGGPSS